MLGKFAPLHLRILPEKWQAYRNEVITTLLLQTWFSLTTFAPCDGVWARERCRISPSRFLAKCRRRLNRGSFVLLCFVLFAFLSCI